MINVTLEIPLATRNNIVAYIRYVDVIILINLYLNNFPDTLISVTFRIRKTIVSCNQYRTIYTIVFTNFVRVVRESASISHIHNNFVRKI